jgi:hypothetical protein
MNSSKELKKMIRAAEDRLAMMLAKNQDDAANNKPPTYSNQAIETQRQEVQRLKDRLQVILQMEQEASDRAREMKPSVSSSTPTSWGKQVGAGALGPSISGNMSYDEMKQTLRNQMMRELQMLSAGAGSIDPRSGYRTKQSSEAGRRRAMDLAAKLQNFDSWFDSMYQSEFGNRNKPQPMPQYPGVPQGAIPMTSTPKPPIMPKPPTQMSGGFGAGKQFDKNGIPMVQSSMGWEKDNRFYKPDGSLFGTM